MAAVTEPHARGAHESGFANEPQCRTGAHPVLRKVHRIAVARQNAETGLVGLVHLLEVMLVEAVVGIEHEERIVLVGGLRIDHRVEQVRQCIALAHLLLVEPFHHMAAEVAGELRRTIVAVVGHEPDVDELAGIALRLDVTNEVTHHLFLVSRGDEHRVPLVHRGGRECDRLGE